MANLENKDKMSALQFSIVLFEIGVGISMITATSDIVAIAKQSAWLSAILGGILFGSAALLMVKLGGFFPEATLVEYMPMLWGRFIGNIIIWWLQLTMMLMFFSALANFSRTITFFLFDRTPTEVVALGMLAVCIYAALQDFDTIARMVQMIFFTVMPLFILIWLPSMINFQPENLLPLWPENFLSVFRASMETWFIFSGYEFILLLLPLVYKKPKQNPSLAICGAFGCMTLIYTLLVIITIGVLSAELIKESPYPILEVVRGIQIPGTFIERLEVYFLLFWIPLAIDTYFVVLWCLAQVMMRQKKYADHRPFVLILAPLLYFCGILIDSMEASKAVGQLNTWLGIIFSFVIVPASLLRACRQKRSDTACKKSIYR